MAQRPVFVPLDRDDLLIKELSVAFSWHKGLAQSQKQKNVKELHQAATARGIAPLLEVSTKSSERLGRELSAFNLELYLNNGHTIPVECAFQGSKLFQRGGPFTDLFFSTPIEAKRDKRLRESGELLEFSFEDLRFPLLPKTGFYDWLYLRAIRRHPRYLSEIEQYAGFTDIEFNPRRSVNCQARSCALVVSLRRRGLLNACVKSPTYLFRILEHEGKNHPADRADVQVQLWHDF